MTEPIFHIPWHCEDSDCPTHWHLATYWFGDCKYTVDLYTDGDHEEIDQEDLPSPEAHDEAWAEYVEYCRTTGEDPVGEFCWAVPKSTKSIERWEACFRITLMGSAFEAARKVGDPHWLTKEDLPEGMDMDLTLIERGGRHILAPEDEAKELPSESMTRLRRHIDEGSLNAKLVRKSELETHFEFDFEVMIPPAAEVVAEAIREAASKRMKKAS